MRIKWFTFIFSKGKCVINKEKDDWECHCSEGYGGNFCEMRVCDDSFDCGENGKNKYQ